jgi:hypothetical protein
LLRQAVRFHDVGSGENKVSSHFSPTIAILYFHRYNIRVGNTLKKPFPDGIEVKSIHQMA